METENSQKKEPSEALKPQEPKKEKHSLESWPEMIKFVRNNREPEIRSRFKEELRKKIEANIDTSKYNVLFLYNEEGSITDYDLNKIHQSLLNLSEKEKDLLLIIHSRGGSVEPAYLISKTCKEKANKNKFVVVIPRKAKSAATLLSLGADEIHMGSISQLGPIDPQINGRPVLGLGNAIEHLAKISEKYPDSSNMFAKYLGYDLDLQKLGYFERISESAAQYAERLLEGKNLPEKQSPRKIARRFTFNYKDHGFVIDKQEAKKYLGDHIKTATPELEFGEDMFEWLDNFNLALNVVKNYSLVVSGDYKNGGVFFEEQK